MSLYNYVYTPNSNLICCICRAPFTDPTTTRTCAHTFCRECILRSLSHSPLCPVDRSPLTTADLSPANPIVRSLVDELLVECIHQPEGCEHTCQRQTIPLHLKDECEYAEVVCMVAGCRETMRRKALQEHVEKVHDKEDEAEQVEAADEEEGDGAEAYSCPHEKVGCPYKGPLKPSEHLTSCPYESLKDFITSNTTKMALLTEQNVMLRHRVDVLESTVQIMRREMAQVKSALGPWSRSSSELPLALQAASAGPSSREEDALAAYFPEGSGARQGTGTLEDTILGLRESVVGLAAGVDQMGRRSEMALANETLRLGEEMMSIRGQMHGLRMQMHGMMMERNGVEYGRVGNTGLGGSITKL
ncbi:hypothetical protein CPB84DRAFT_1677486 [Gymnopilus junonius]|uniref:RING-type domain-containing protein n=1 Tax=Gymnopilus junonius TaxID=109634 RepID=A0A9P5NUN5_GYMJU|nr:hypothetical protein CPB84DRAFT_1677486 [Gymnopilus junonius]